MLIVLTCVGLAAPAVAQQKARDAVALVAEAGYEPRDLSPLSATLAAFISPDTQIGAVGQALLLLGAQEEPISEASYSLHADQQIFDGVPATIVDIERYNCDPQMQQVSDPNGSQMEMFGHSPDVAWRFVFQPQDGDAAALVAAGRREIPQTEDTAADCP